MRIVLAAAALAAVVAALCGAGAPAARATSCTTVPGYPGDRAAKAAIAAWMATGATTAGIPGELPVMGALVESGVTNREQGDTDAAGYFAMRVAICSGTYPGFPDHPEVQLRWFTDQALAARQQRAAAGIDNADPRTWGDWVADVERPAEQFRGRYQPQLANAQALIAAGCPTPPAAPPPVIAAPPPPVAVAPVTAAPGDTTPPALALSRTTRERLTRAGVRVRLRCPGEACRARVRGTLAVAGRRHPLRLRSVTATLRAGHARTLALRVPRSARRLLAQALRRGVAVRARLRITVVDAAGNATVRARVVRMV